MASIPIPQQDTQTVFPNVSSDSLQGNAGPIARGGLALAGGLDTIGQGLDYGANVLAKHALAFQGLANEATAKDADIKGMVAIGKLEDAYYTLQGKNRVDAMPKFITDVQALRQSMLAGMPNQAAARMFDDVFARRIGYSITSASRGAAEENRKYQIQTSEARVSASIDDATRHYNDDQWFNRSVGIVVDEARQQGEMMGWSPETTAQHAAQYTSEAWKARLMQVTDDDPHAALKMYEANSDKLDASAQLQVEHGIRTAIKVQASEARAAADHAMAMADRTIRLSQDHNASVLWQEHFDGKLDLKTLEKYRDDLNQADFTALGHAVTGEGAQHNDPDTIIALTTAQAAENPEVFAEDAAQALRDRKISVSTYQSMVSTNRSLLKDDQPLSPYRAARDTLTKSLDPGLLSGAGSTMLRVNQANALKEYDDWTVANPGATRDQVFRQEQSILKRYQLMSFDQMSMTLGLPKYFSGQRSEIKAPDLDAAEKAALDAYDNSALTESQLADELQRIKAWREILAKTPAGTKLPEKPPDDTTQPPANPAMPGSP